MATVTRADLAVVVHREAGLPRRDAAKLMDMAIEAIAERLSAGECQFGFEDYPAILECKIDFPERHGGGCSGSQ